MATVRLPQDFKEFLRLLKEHDVRYLLIGAYAVNYYGYIRATGDMDVWVAVHPDNAEKLVHVLKQFGFENDPEITPNCFCRRKRLFVLAYRLCDWKFQRLFQALNLRSVTDLA